MANIKIFSVISVLAVFLSLSIVYADTLQVGGEFNIPNVTLISPTGQPNITTSPNFVANASTEGYEPELVNMTLHIWNSTGLVGTNSTDVSGQSNQSNLTFNFPRSDIYTWSYKACHNESNCEFADENRTLIYDITPPNIDIIKPEDTSTTYEELTIPLEVNLTDELNTIKEECYYNLSYSSGGTNFSAYRNWTQVNCSGGYLDTTFHVNDDGYYTMNFKANDSLDNQNITNRTFYVYVPPTETNPEAPPAAEEEEPVAEAEENVTIEAVCGNGLCEEGESRFTLPGLTYCPQDCGGINIDDMILSCFSGTGIGDKLGVEDSREVRSRCIITQSPVIFWLGIGVFLLGGLFLFSKTEPGRKYLIKYPKKRYKRVKPKIPKWIKDLQEK